MTLVGTVVIPEGREYQRSYEVAAWWTKMALTPGVYDVHAAVRGGGGGMVTLGARVPGVIVSSYTVSLFGGVPFGTEPQYDKHRDVGRADEVVLTIPFDDVILAGDAGEELCWRIFHAPGALEFNGHGIGLSEHRSLFFIKSVFGCEYRIDPNDGGLPIFTDEPHTLQREVNRLLYLGFDPDVWRVCYTDKREPWFETPFEDHRPYKDHRFSGSMKARDNWRYYQPDYNPRRSAA